MQPTRSARSPDRDRERRAGCRSVDAVPSMPECGSREAHKTYNRALRSACGLVHSWNGGDLCTLGTEAILHTRNGGACHRAGWLRRGAIEHGGSGDEDGGRGGEDHQTPSSESRERRPRLTNCLTVLPQQRRWRGVKRRESAQECLQAQGADVRQVLGPNLMALAKSWDGSQNSTGRRSWMECELLGRVRKLMEWRRHTVMAPDWCKEDLPHGIIGMVIDGDLFKGRSAFQDLMRVRRKHVPDHEARTQITSAVSRCSSCRRRVEITPRAPVTNSHTRNALGA
eukprot:3451312-Rhodomonas_salina.1